jgi:hypothetical protein
VDPLRQNDLERARETSAETKAAQALECMRLGIQLKRESLQRRFPDEDESAIEARLLRWLARDE